MNEFDRLIKCVYIASLFNSRRVKEYVRWSITAEFEDTLLHDSYF